MEQRGLPLELGTDDVWRLLLRYAIPSVIAMTATSLYNIIDSIFIGHGVGANAIAGLAITFPLMNVGVAFGSLIGIGSSALLSLRLGQKDYETANQILGNVLILNLITGISYTILILIFLRPVLLFFGASEDTLPYARDYIEKADKKRAGYYNYFTSKKWGAAGSYDLCINSSTLGIEETVEFIVKFAGKRFGLG